MKQKNRPYSGMARTSSGSIISGYNQQNGWDFYLLTSSIISVPLVRWGSLDLCWLDLLLPLSPLPLRGPNFKLDKLAKAVQNHCLEYMSEYMSEDPSHQICQSKCQNTCQRHVTWNFAISDARLYEGVDVTIFARIYFKTQTSVRLHVRLHVRIYDRT